jgi:hypothetical protein
LRVPDGYGCVAIEDVNDIEALSARLAAIAQDPEPIPSVAARGHAFARATQAEASDPDGLERLLKSAARRRAPSRRRQPISGTTTEAEDPRFPITQLAARVLKERSELRGASEALALPNSPIDLPQARCVLTAAETVLASGDSSMRPVASAIKLEMAIAEAESAIDAQGPVDSVDPLFRLRTKRWAMIEADLPGLVPVRDPQLRMMTFDASELVDGQSGPKCMAIQTPRSRHVVAFSQVNGERREPLFISDLAARILELSDGARTAMEIATEVGSDQRSEGVTGALRQIEELFVSGLLWLHDRRIDSIEIVTSETP